MALNIYSRLRLIGTRWFQTFGPIKRRSQLSGVILYYIGGSVPVNLSQLSGETN